MLGKASRHSGESISSFWGKHHFWMYCLAPEDVTTKKCDSLASEAKWNLKHVCACMEEGFSDIFFHFSYTQVSVFHFSQKGVTVSKAIISISCRDVPLTMSLCCSCFLSGYTVFLTTAILSRIDTLEWLKICSAPSSELSGLWESPLEYILATMSSSISFQL